MRLVLILLLVGGCLAVETEYVVLSAADRVLRVGDVAQAMWMGIEAGGLEPLITETSSRGIALRLDDVRCESLTDQNFATCSLPASGRLVGSGLLRRNGTHVSLFSQDYRVSIVARLENATWNDVFGWTGNGTLILTVHEQSPTERKERVWKGLVAFLTLSPIVCGLEGLFSML